ncbi:MAG: hypothetical protein BM564_11495 [Bacteroidetes bacterium MedPE-SWsnd-G2]|nr:MAG: hypothetical protein BM564_11495 [Bacteroidetes bacterium MedPE-SWsnd-G2]
MPNNLSAQTLKELDSLSAKEVIDTLLIDRDVKNWSVRVYTNFKEQRFKLKNDEYQTEYVPHNTTGVGLGFATKKLILDLGINIKTNKEEKTERFDVQFSFLFHQHHMLDVSIQSYKGFETRTNYDVPTTFRTDISNFTNTLSYWYIPNSKKFSILQLKTGLSKPTKSTVVLGFGGFLTYYKLKSDYSIIPEHEPPVYNDFAQLTNFTGIGGGINGGFFSVIHLPYNFFLSINVLPGIGLMHKTAQTSDLKYHPKDIFIYKLDAQILLQYNYKQFYTNISAGQSIYNIGLDHANSAQFIITKAKFVIGYNIGGYLKSTPKP